MTTKHTSTGVTEPDFSYGEYTYADYLKWTIEERLELIKGKIFRMSPAPDRKHQELVANLHGYLWSFLREKTCKAFVAPFDVRLSRESQRDEDVITVVQPDVCVVCDHAKLDKRGCIGAPDIVIEVLSPSNNRIERNSKINMKCMRSRA
jgi:Uma2 family endonuclease